MHPTRVPFPSAIGTLLPEGADHATHKWLPRVRATSGLSGDPQSLKLTAEDLEWVRRRLEAELREHAQPDLDNRPTVKISRTDIEQLRQAAEAAAARFATQEVDLSECQLVPNPTDSQVTQEVVITDELRAHATRKPVLQVAPDPELSMVVSPVRPATPSLRLEADPFTATDPSRMKLSLLNWLTIFALFAVVGLVATVAARPELQARLWAKAKASQAWLIGVQEELVTKVQGEVVP